MNLHVDMQACHICLTSTIVLSIAIVKFPLMENPLSKKIVSEMFCLYCAYDIWMSLGNEISRSSLGRVQLILSSVVCNVHCRLCSYEYNVLRAHFVQYNMSSIGKSIVIIICLHSLQNGLNGGKKTSLGLSTRVTCNLFCS